MLPRFSLSLLLHFSSQALGTTPLGFHVGWRRLRDCYPQTGKLSLDFPVLPPRIQFTPKLSEDNYGLICVRVCLLFEEHFARYNCRSTYIHILQEHKQKGCYNEPVFLSAQKMTTIA